jgi:hypothetical protein
MLVKLEGVVVVVVVHSAHNIGQFSLKGGPIKG